MNELKFLANKLPFYLIFYPTSRCNARCPHCYNHLKQGRASIEAELTLDEIMKISSKFGHIKVLTISGGEPFLRGDLLEAVSVFCRNNKVQYVSLHTNGYLTGKIIKVVKGLMDSFPGLRVIVCISIDAVGEAHDGYRGIDGGFEKITRTIEELNSLKKEYKHLYLVSATIFSRSTQDSLSGTIGYIRQNFKGVKPSLSFIRGDAKDSREKDIDLGIYRDFHKYFTPRPDYSIRPFSVMAFKEALEACVNKIVAKNYMTQKQAIACQAGKRLVVIYDNGDVFPCEISPDGFGNLREVNYDIGKLLFSVRGKEVKNKVAAGKSCSCTWENIIPVNLLFSPAHYPFIAYEWFRLFFLARKSGKGQS